jgi:hypothetical protein
VEMGGLYRHGPKKYASARRGKTNHCKGGKKAQKVNIAKADVDCKKLDVQKERLDSLDLCVTTEVAIVSNDLN